VGQKLAYQSVGDFTALLVKAGPVSHLSWVPTARADIGMQCEEQFEGSNHVSDAVYILQMGTGPHVIDSSIIVLLISQAVFSFFRFHEAYLLPLFPVTPCGCERVWTAFGQFQMKSIGSWLVVRHLSNGLLAWADRLC
jgi:hypothetical protein